MGTYQTVRQVIESKLKTNWEMVTWQDTDAVEWESVDVNWTSENASTTIPIAWDNVAYTPITKQAFLRILIEDVLSKQISIESTPCTRRIGLIHIMIMVPKNSGMATAYVYADRLSTIFRNLNESNVRCQSPRLRNVGPVDQWHQLSLLVPFYIND